MAADGHWWPETYYLGTIQAREALYEVRSSNLAYFSVTHLLLCNSQVLAETVAKEDLSENQAVSIVRNALFHNANKVYNLHLVPNIKARTPTVVSDSALQSLIESGINFIRIQWVDLANITRHHVVPIARFRTMVTSSEPGIMIDGGPLPDLLTSETGEPYFYRLDMGSLRTYGYAAEHTAMLGWFEDKSFVEHTSRRALLCPRALLQDAIK